VAVATLSEARELLAGGRQFSAGVLDFNLHDGPRRRGSGPGPGPHYLHRYLQRLGARTHPGQERGGLHGQLEVEFLGSMIPPPRAAGRDAAPAGLPDCHPAGDCATRPWPPYAAHPVTSWSIPPTRCRRWTAWAGGQSAARARPVRTAGPSSASRPRDNFAAGQIPLRPESTTSCLIPFEQGMISEPGVPLG
jgi:hypothetical protein